MSKRRWRRRRSRRWTRRRGRPWRWRRAGRGARRWGWTRSRRRRRSRTRRRSRGWAGRKRGSGRGERRRRRARWSRRRRGGRRRRGRGHWGRRWRGRRRSRLLAALRGRVVADGLREDAALMPQPERPVLVRAPAGDALLLQPELPNEERRYLQPRLHLPNAVARLVRVEFGEVIRPRLEGVETLGERVVYLPLVPASRPIAPLVGERLRLRRGRAWRWGRRGGWGGGRRRGGGRSRGVRRGRRRARRGVVAGERRRGCGRRGRRLRRERRRVGGRRRRGRRRRRRRAFPLRDHKEDAYDGGEDGERQQDGASALAAAGRTSSPAAVRPVALPTS